MTFFGARWMCVYGPCRCRRGTFSCHVLPGGITPGCPSATGRGVLPLGGLFYVLLLAATRRGSCDEKLCVRTQISDMHALLCLKPARYPHQNAGATGSVIIDPVLGSCFS